MMNFPKTIQADFNIHEEQLVDAYIRQMIELQIEPFNITLQSPQIQAFQTSMVQQEQQCSKIPDRILTYNRKQKSLSQLTRKFIQNFQGSKSTILILDQITVEMNVERRRIYDIINIMESLNVVGKVKKNVYQWKGLKEAIKTINRIQNQDFQQFDLQDKIGSKNKKQKSLQSLAGQFLRIFSKKKQALTLEQASLYVLSDEYKQIRKTKIRRLYDIVNVFKCMGLIEKVKNEGSKPIYKWMGCSLLHQIILQKGTRKTAQNISSPILSEQHKQNTIFQIQLKHEIKSQPIKGYQPEVFIEINKLQNRENMKQKNEKSIKKINQNSLSLDSLDPHSSYLFSFITQCFDNSVEITYQQLFNRFSLAVFKISEESKQQLSLKQKNQNIQNITKMKNKNNNFQSRYQMSQSLFSMVAE